ncbi:hypothetical protein IFM89_023321 [Coptis chinensis]|uniref:VIN3-like fibronectin type-III domain-containing protein n=1 Tax=Coptis chinensis TaxID=261450 RepID=A0A835HCL1_9MAGN|nr:hypothetical protein IFM89_023321 [Coptis chinensis]
MLPSTARFQFEELTSSSLVIVLRDILSASSEVIKGYKLWYCKGEDEPTEKNLFVSFQSEISERSYVLLGHKKKDVLIGFAVFDGEEECCGRNSSVEPEAAFEDKRPDAANNFDLNVASYDLNAYNSHGIL